MHTLICCQPFTMPRTIWHLLNWATWLLTHTGGGDGVYVGCYVCVCVFVLKVGAGALVMEGDLMGVGWFHRVSMFYFTNRHNFTRIVCHLSRDNKIFNFMFSLFLVHARTHTHMRTPHNVCVHLQTPHHWLTTRKTVRIVSSTYTLICSRDWCHIFLRLSIQRIHHQQWLNVHGV